jgi:DNA polymerase III subunit gamma/tau
VLSSNPRLAIISIQTQKLLFFRRRVPSAAAVVALVARFARCFFLRPSVCLSPFVVSPSKHDGNRATNPVRISHKSLRSYNVYVAVFRGFLLAASLALARKYRPRNFSELMGQEHVVRALSHALETGRLHQAYLLTGTRGVGKTTIARILAKTLNCETGVTPNPCGVCQTCQDIDAGRFPDLLELDAASNTGVDNMREIIDNARYAPTAGRYKVYLIDEVHMLSKSAFNSMLKTLEEPPEHVKFVLATTDPQKIPVTVLSRCLQFALKQFPPERVAEQLHKVLTAENIPFDAPALRLIGEAAQGSMRDALSIADQAIAFGHGKVEEQQVRQMLGNVDRDFVWRVLDAVIARDAQALNVEVEHCFEQALAADDALAQLARALHRVALAQAVPATAAADDLDAAHIARVAAALNAEEIQLYYQIALHGRDDLRLAPDEQTALTMTFLRLLAFAPTSGASAEREPVIAGRSSNPSPARSPSPVSRGHPLAPVGTEAPDRAGEGGGIGENLRSSSDVATASALTPTLSRPAGEGEKAASAKVEGNVNVAAEVSVNKASASLESPTAPEPATQRTFDGNWLSLVNALPLAAMARELARHSAFKSFEKNVMTLALPQDKRPLATQKERLAGTLSEYFGRAIKLEIELTDNVGETVVARDKQEKDAKQTAAEAAFMADPAVQVLLTEGQGKVRAGSIQAT